MTKKVLDKNDTSLHKKSPFASNSIVSSTSLRSKLSKSIITDNIIGKPIRHITDKKLSHSVLDKHQVIAWDLDETIVYGKQSWFWRRWIRDNHQDRVFWIITFRTEINNIVWHEIETCNDPVNRNWFKGIINIPKVLWTTWASFQPCLRDITHEEQITTNIIKVARKTNVDLDRLIDVNRAIRAWKATECKKHGATVLVEDREQFCKPYCDLLGIEFVNALKD